MIFSGGDSWPALVWKMKTNLTKLMFENLENNYNVLIIKVLTLWNQILQYSIPCQDCQAGLLSCVRTLTEYEQDYHSHLRSHLHHGHRPPRHLCGGQTARWYHYQGAQERFLQFITKVAKMFQSTMWLRRVSRKIILFSLKTFFLPSWRWFWHEQDGEPHRRREAGPGTGAYRSRVKQNPEGWVFLPAWNC